ncbi:MAG TPA: hypothetical protein VFQ53_27705 [Kofleriaceae bacterium]|nr:hypothetical protein [Kofleriaceae bacterium]
MIPYDDLVLALANWRTKQGLPVGSLPPSVAARIAAGETTPSVPRTSPPMAPPKGYAAETQDDPMDVDESALLEEAHDDVAQYEAEGDAFGSEYGEHADHDAESTAIGVAPSPAGGRDSFGGGATQPDEFTSRTNGGRNRGW